MEKHPNRLVWQVESCSSSDDLLIPTYKCWDCVVADTYCKPLAISDPIRLSTSAHHIHPFLVGHRVKFECRNQNEVPVGATSAYCMGNGAWTDKAPMNCVNPGGFIRCAIKTYTFVCQKLRSMTEDRRKFC